MPQTRNKRPALSVYALAVLLSSCASAQSEGNHKTVYLNFSMDAALEKQECLPGEPIALLLSVVNRQDTTTSFSLHSKYHFSVEIKNTQNVLFKSRYVQALDRLGEESGDGFIWTPVDTGINISADIEPNAKCTFRVPLAVWCSTWLEPDEYIVHVTLMNLSGITPSRKIGGKEVNLSYDKLKLDKDIPLRILQHDDAAVQKRFDEMDMIISRANGGIATNEEMFCYDTLIYTDSPMALAAQIRILNRDINLCYSSKELDLYRNLSGLQSTEDVQRLVELWRHLVMTTPPTRYYSRLREIEWCLTELSHSPSRDIRNVIAPIIADKKTEATLCMGLYLDALCFFYSCE